MSVAKQGSEKREVDGEEVCPCRFFFLSRDRVRRKSRCTECGRFMFSCLGDGYSETAFAVLRDERQA